MGTTIALIITLLIMLPIISLAGWIVWFFWDWNRDIKEVQKYGSERYSWKYNK